MKEAINPNTLFNTIAMARQGTSALILVAEGDDDSFLLSWHRNPDDLILIEGGGREVALGAADLVHNRTLGGVRFLIDSDYDRFTKSQATYPPNVIASTFHDVMMDVLLADLRTIDIVVATQCRSTARSGTKIDPELVRKQAFELASNVARVRIIDGRDDLTLRLSPFPFGVLSAVPPNLAEVCELAVIRSETHHTPETLADEVKSDASCQELVPEDAVGDHDFFRALSRILKHHGVLIKDTTLFTAFLAAIGCSQISLTGWHQQISSWGQDNSRDVFNCPCTAA